MSDCTKKKWLIFTVSNHDWTKWITLKETIESGYVFGGTRFKLYQKRTCMNCNEEDIRVQEAGGV